MLLAVAVAVELIALFVRVLLLSEAAPASGCPTSATQKLYTPRLRNLIHIKATLLVIWIVHGHWQQEHLARYQLSRHQFIQLLYATFAV